MQGIFNAIPCTMQLAGLVSGAQGLLMVAWPWVAMPDVGLGIADNGVDDSQLCLELGIVRIGRAIVAKVHFEDRGKIFKWIGAAITFSKVSR